MNLIFENISYYRKKFALRDISFEIREGYITALAGKNGAGKTTLFHLLLDKNAAYEGMIYADGKDWKQSQIELMNQIGFVSDEQRFFMERTAAENAGMMQWLYDEFSMVMFRENMERMRVSIHRALKDLSRGEYIKYQLAFAMAHNTKLYLLDEATAGMDVVFKKDFFRMLHELLLGEHCAVFMSTHIQDEIEKHMDYIVVMDDGKIVSKREVGMQ